MSATSCSDVIRLAMQRLRQLRAGETPTAQELSDGMIALQSMYDQWTADGLFGRLNDVIPSSDYTANEQDRVINDGGYTITLPTTIQPVLPTSGAWPWGSDASLWYPVPGWSPRPPLDLSCIEIVQSGTTQRNLYDRVTRAWIRLDGLASTSAAPLANRGLSGLSACLAIAWCDDFGVQPAPSIVAASTSFKWGLSARYDSTRIAARQDYF